MSMPVPSVPASSIALWVPSLSSARDRISNHQPANHLLLSEYFWLVSKNKTQFIHIRHYPQQQLSVPEVVPHNLYQIVPQAAQIIIIEEESRRRHHESRHHESRHHESQHETHFHSAGSVKAPQYVTSSTSNAPTNVEYLEPRHYTDHHSHHRHSSPRSHSDTHRHSDTHYHSDTHHHSGSHPDTYHHSDSHPDTHRYSGSRHHSDSHHHTNFDRHLNSRHYTDDPHHQSYHRTEDSSYRPNSSHSAHRYSEESTSHTELAGPRLQSSPLPFAVGTSARHSSGEFMYGP